ncbi:uncharacterized protein BYT42DRAFT_594103 [Radiomyces spectabilis]|uniref:uncharacterized protein n=1 Tax=Radiomyces spectabilis TaxID=64574 RepID=UPI00221E575B|nr:uncharacterized protein BYT42DRAFT_594103 [Radiomyces spectabilis]KAI8376003.1 hypothetical protein BYT42DRAFT_594103 [Radiomyces spectabilis]
MVHQFQQGNSEDAWNVLVWCSMPIPFDDCETLPCDYSDTLDDDDHAVKGGPKFINFWFFLWWYYGIYNAIALFLITKLFSIYALNWWPKCLGAKCTFAFFWLESQGLAVIMHYFLPSFEKYTLSWVFLTFFTMSMPLWFAMVIIHKRHQRRRATRLLAPKGVFTPLHPLPRWRLPASYRRFMWFCTSLAIALLALIGGEIYAYIFLSTLPHTSLDALAYVYSWVGAIYIMDAITDYIICRKIRSHPLASIFKLWEKIGRSFYLRNLAENTTMLGFLIWFNVLHFGPNRAAYPYFYMDDRDGNPYNHNKTFLAAIVIWTSELTSAWITRHTFRRAFSYSITKQAVRDFARYPEMIIAFVLLMIHVLQNILLALIKLDFATQNHVYHHYL